MQDDANYCSLLKKEAEFWGKMAELRAGQGIPDTMDYSLATKGIIDRSALGWGDYIQDRETELRTPYGIAKKNFVAYASRFENLNVLDLGCGAGWLSLEMVRGGVHVDAVDCSLGALRVAKDYHKKALSPDQPKVNWVVADMNKMPLNGNPKYDLITSWDALHHVANIDHLLENLFQATKEDGSLLICERVQGGKLTTRLRIGLIIRHTINLFFPMLIPYKTRLNNFKNILSLIKSKLLPKKTSASKASCEDIHDDCLVSPFEDVCGIEMIEKIEKHYQINKIYSYRAFSDEIERSLYFGDKYDFLRKFFTIIVSWIDYFLIKTRLLQGQIIILYCTKKPDA